MAETTGANSNKPVISAFCVLLNSDSKRAGPTTRDFTSALSSHHAFAPRKAMADTRKGCQELLATTPRMITALNMIELTKESTEIVGSAPVRVRTVSPALPDRQHVPSSSVCLLSNVPS